MSPFLLLACVEREPELPALRPHVVIVLADGLAQPGPRLGALPVQGRLEPSATRPDADEDAWLTGTWPVALLGASASAEPNTMQQVLSLYGYRTVALLGPGSLVGGRAVRFDRVDRAPADVCPAAWIEEARAAFLEPGPALLVLDTKTSACADWDLELGRLLDALAPALGRALVVVEPGLGSSGPLALSGGSPRSVVGQTSDVLPTVLGFAGAVVPSDAQGTSLDSPAVGEGRPTFTIGEDRFVARAGTLTLTVERPATGWPLELDATPPPVGFRAEREGAAIDAADEAVTRLWPVVRVWYGRMRATDAKGRMGNAAFETMLKEQGYW